MKTKKILLSLFLTICVFNLSAQTSKEEIEALKGLDSLSNPNYAAGIKNQKEIGVAINVIKKINVLNSQYSKQLDVYEKVDNKAKIRQEILYLKFLLTEISAIYSQGVFFLNKENTITLNEKEAYEEKYNSTIIDALDDFDFGIRIVTKTDLKLNESKIISIVEDLKAKQFERRDLIAFYNDKINFLSEYNHLNISVDSKDQKINQKK